MARASSPLARRVAQGIQRARVAPVVFHRLFEIPQRVFDIAAIAQSEAALVMRLAIVRVEHNGLIEILHRLVGLAFGAIGLAAARIGFGRLLFVDAGGVDDGAAGGDASIGRNIVLAFAGLELLARSGKAGRRGHR